MSCTRVIEPESSAAEYPRSFGSVVSAIADRLAAESGNDRDVYARAWLEATGVPVTEAVMQELFEYGVENGKITRTVTIQLAPKDMSGGCANCRPCPACGSENMPGRS